MKQFILIAALLLVCSASKAALISSNLFTLAVVNNATNTGTPIILGTITVPATTFTIQNLGLANTNAFGMDIQLGFATNAMTTVGTYQPGQTNAVIDSFSLTNSGVVRIYCQVVMRTTNSVTAGAQSIQNK
jgi:hypothetical protein